MIALGIGLAVATGVAGAMNEGVGVALAHVAAVVLGAGIAGWRGARASRGAGVIAAMAGGIAGLLLAAGFFEGVWPGL